MRRRPNYRQDRAQKDRVRESRKQEKLQRLEEASARRKAAREGTTGGNATEGSPEPAENADAVPKAEDRGR